MSAPRTERGRPTASSRILPQSALGAPTLPLFGSLPRRSWCLGTRRRDDARLTFGLPLHRRQTAIAQLRVHTLLTLVLALNRGLPIARFRLHTLLALVLALNRGLPVTLQRLETLLPLRLALCNRISLRSQRPAVSLELHAALSPRFGRQLSPRFRRHQSHIGPRTSEDIRLTTRALGKRLPLPLETALLGSLHACSAPVVPCQGPRLGRRQRSRAGLHGCAQVSRKAQALTPLNLPSDIHWDDRRPDHVARWNRVDPPPCNSFDPSRIDAAIDDAVADNRVVRNVGGVVDDVVDTRRRRHVTGIGGVQEARGTHEDPTP